MSGSTSEHPPQLPMAVFVLLEAEPALWLGPRHSRALTVPDRASSGVGSASPCQRTAVAMRAESLCPVMEDRW
jgi:hypothetical protein